MAVIAAVSALIAGPARGEEVPDWVTEAGDRTIAAALAYLFPDSGAGEPVTITRAWEADRPARRDISGRADASGISITYEGEGWRQRSPSGVRSIEQNVAHEIAHVWQRRLVDDPLEADWWHEGIADALAVELLVETGTWSVADGRGYRRGNERRCRKALARGSLGDRFAAPDRDAVYGCGAVIVTTLAETSGTSVREAYRAWSVAPDRVLGFGGWVEQVAGPAFADQLLAFVAYDYRHGADTALQHFRAGRL